MAVLSETERQQVYRGVLRWYSSNGPVPVANKADIRAAVDATDDWIDTNAAAFNSALPHECELGAKDTFVLRRGRDAGERGVCAGVVGEC